ncbi:MAG TPA: hypothetical protein VGB92_07030 [Longimicrobium sp.]|jgi:hypothetical protein
MITAQQAEAFWSVVEECLVRFHEYPASLASQQVAEFRSYLVSAPGGMRKGMVFHAEPFDVASRIADSELPLLQVSEEYAVLMAAAFPAEPEPFAVRERQHGYGP